MSDRAPQGPHLRRLAARKAWRGHWGQRLLVPPQGLADNFMGDSQPDSVAVLSVPYVILVSLCCFLLGLIAPQAGLDSVWGLVTLLCALGLLVVIVLSLQLAAWQLVARPLFVKQWNEIKKATDDHPELLNAMLNWMEPDDILRQSDYRLFLRARREVQSGIQAQAAENQSPAPSQEKDKPIKWQNHLIFVVAQRAKCSPLQDQIDNEEKTAPLHWNDLARRYARKARSAHAIGKPGSKLRRWAEALSREVGGTMDFSNDIRWVLAGSMTLSCVGYCMVAGFLWLLSSLVLGPRGSLDALLPFGLLGSLTLYLLILFPWMVLIAWHRGQFMPTYSAMDEARKSFCEFPVLVSMFFSRLPDGHLLSYRDLVLGMRLVHIERDWVRGNEEKNRSREQVECIRESQTARHFLSEKMAKRLDEKTAQATSASKHVRRL